jgi:ABC-type nitrate/sulfonate/bicarbonate transport system permease component
VYNYIIVLGLVGYMLDYSLTRLRDKMSPWFENGK